MLVASALTPSPSPRNPNSGEANELTNFQVLGIASAVGLVLSVVIFILASMILYRCKKKHHHQRQDNYVPLATREDGSAHIPQSLESCTSQPNENNSFSVDELMNSSSAISKESKAGGQWHGGSSIALLPSVIERHHAQENGEKDSESTEVRYKYGNATEDLFWVPASREDELRAQLLDLHVPEVPRADIEVYEVLGSGQFGMVHRGVWLDSKQELIMEVALKCLLTRSREEERVKFLQETATMGQFKHPNVLGIVGVVTTSEPLMILCEIMHKGDLHHYLKSLRTSSNGASPTTLAALFLSFCQQVASGMAYLAYKLYVHGNLEARNVLVSSGDVCKITNFGMSRNLQDEESTDTCKVRIRWMAPEVLTLQKHSTASDVWSYGILLYEIWTMGVKPYHNYTSRETVQKVLSGYRLSPPSGCPQGIYQLMLNCWNCEAESRLAFSEIVSLLQNSNLLAQGL